MGAFLTRHLSRIQEDASSTTVVYRYPPKSGCYFGSTFIMGGEKFHTTQPEAYLFGENSDLNFLTGRPMPFPLPTPTLTEPTRMLQSLVNIRKDSIRFVKALDAMSREKEDKDKDVSELPTKYNIEFIFDTDVDVAITVYYFATEDLSQKEVRYKSRDATMNSETYHYHKGSNQTFVQTSHVITPSLFPEHEWQLNPDSSFYPIVIQCIVQDQDPAHKGHSHATLAAIDKCGDKSYTLKPLKQKQFVDGMYFLLQEIYGIENKNQERLKLEEDFEDTGLECVICMSDMRDTLILPCRHLCLCHGCADDLRYQANNCPICRAPFRALLQVRALRKKLTNPSSEEDLLLTGVNQDDLPPGYEAVSLIDALNGPLPPRISDNTYTAIDQITSSSPASLRRNRKHRKSSSLRGSGSRRRRSEDSRSLPGPASQPKADTSGHVDQDPMEVVKSNIDAKQFQDRSKKSTEYTGD